MASVGVINSLIKLVDRQYDDIMSHLIANLDGQSLTLEEAVTIDRLAKKQLAEACKKLRSLDQDI